MLNKVSFFMNEESLTSRWSDHLVGVASDTASSNERVLV
jgi:hypothetical protein